MIVVGRCVLVAGILAGIVACSPAPPAGQPGGSSPAPAPSATTVRSTTPSPTTSPPASTTAADPAGRLPGDLTPNVVEDECLLTAEELGALAGRGGLRGENTELAVGAARRSCFYAPAVADEPVARIDVYASASLPPPELVAKIAANGGKPVPGVGQGAVVVTAQDGSSELVVASPALLAVLTLLPGASTSAPSDQAWAAAGTAIAGRLPR